MERAGKALDAGDVRQDRCGQAARRGDDEAGGEALGTVGFEHPAVRRLVKVRSRHPGVELDIAAQVVLLGNVLQVVLRRKPGELGAGRVDDPDLAVVVRCCQARAVRAKL